MSNRKTRYCRATMEDETGGIDYRRSLLQKTDTKDNIYYRKIWLKYIDNYVDAIIDAKFCLDHATSETNPSYSDVYEWILEFIFQLSKIIGANVFLEEPGIKKHVEMGIYDLEVPPGLRPDIDLFDAMNKLLNKLKEINDPIKISEIMGKFNIPKKLKEINEMSNKICDGSMKKDDINLSLSEEINKIIESIMECMELIMELIDEVNKIYEKYKEGKISETKKRGVEKYLEETMSEIYDYLVSISNSYRTRSDNTKIQRNASLIRSYADLIGEWVRKYNNRKFWEKINLENLIKIEEKISSMYDFMYEKIRSAKIASHNFSSHKPEFTGKNASRTRNVSYSQMISYFRSKR